MSDDYFTATEQQLRALCERRAHRSARSWWMRWISVGRPVVGLAAGVAVALVVAVIALVSLGHGRVVQPPAKRTSGGSSVPHLAVPAGVSAELRGLAQSGTRLGSPDARVTVTLWGDLQCPLCRAFVLSPAFRELLGQVRAGKASLFYRSLCTATCHGPLNGLQSRIFAQQQAAAYAAGEQHQFWNYALAFLANQGAEGTPYVNDSYLTALARLLPGLDLNRWQHARQQPALLARARADESAGRAANIIGTPTLVFTGPHGTQTIPGPGTTKPFPGSGTQPISAPFTAASVAGALAAVR